MQNTQGMGDGVRMRESPLEDGCHMPGEFEPHDGCIVIWPERPGSWGRDPEAARRAFAAVIKAVAGSEKVYVAASKEGMDSARRLLLQKPQGNYIEIFEAETDDSWARDIGPTFVVPKHRESTRARAVNWSFNAWGGTVDGLYASWERDDAFARCFADKYGFALYDVSPFVLDGGSVHSDGEGAVITTEACLLSAGRNPSLSKGEIEDYLKKYLGAEKILWLPHGIYGDETNEHVDNVCAFIRPGEVVLAWTDDENDPQYAFSSTCLDYLNSVRDAKGRKITVHKLPIPDYPVRVTERDMENYVFAEGEDVREVGERLAASYVNFYFSNDAVIMPAFAPARITDGQVGCGAMGDVTSHGGHAVCGAVVDAPDDEDKTGMENAASDARAAAIMRKLVPEREVIQIPARDILLGGGNIHCITQQIPSAGT